MLEILIYILIEDTSSQYVLIDWYNVIGFMDNVLFWLKQLGIICIETISQIAQSVQKRAMFWIGKMI